jgi:flagellar hook-associated protein 1 FlgK
MSDLLSIMSAASSSLAAQRAVTATAGHNLDNVNTPGYARQRAELATVLPAEQVNGAYIGRGATMETVSQARDRFLEAQLPAAIGSAAHSAEESAALSSVSALNPSATGGLASSLSSFFTQLRALSQNAGDAGLRLTTVSSAKNLARAFNQTRGALESARSGLDQTISGHLPEVNTLAQNVADLNRQIRAARASGGQPNDLLDARQNALDRLSELTGASQVPSSEGVNVVLGAGVGLVTGDTAATLAVAPDVANAGHVAVSLTWKGASPTTLAGSAFGGTIGGALSARDGALATAVSQLDTLAYDFASAVNTVHQSGYGLDGGSGRDLFTVGGTSDGAARDIVVSAEVLADPGALAAASSPTSVPGDSQNLLALIATESQALSSGSDAAGTLSAITAGFGAAAQRASAASDQDAAVKKSFTDLRQSVSGVSSDEELIAMQAAQRAYEAIAKVIQTSNEMMQTLLSIKTT